MPAVELLVGINAHDQQAFDLGPLEGPVSFERLVGRDQNLPPVFQAITLHHVPHQVVPERRVQLEQSPPSGPAAVLGHLPEGGQAQDRPKEQHGAD